MKIQRRLHQHFWLLRRGKHKNRNLQELWNRTGGIGFSAEIVEVCDGFPQLAAAESKWIAATQASLNRQRVTGKERRQPERPPRLKSALLLTINGREYLGLEDAAAHLGLAPKTVYDLVRERGNQFSYTPQAMPVIVGGAKYRSLSAAARSLRTTKDAIRSIVARGENPKDETRSPQAVAVLGVVYESQRAAARALNVHKKTIAKHLERGTLDQFVQGLADAGIQKAAFAA
jgi:hypothetical protein